VRFIALLLRLLFTAGIAYVAGFFVAGAIVFPIDQPYYASRVLVSLGFMAIVYGAESVLWQGHFETCGFASGNCTQHDYSAAGWLASAIMFLIALLIALRRERRLGRAASSEEAAN
jgi:hypothetical protein